MESSSTQRLVPHFVAKHPLIVLKISLGTTNVNLMVVKEEEVKKRIPIKWWFQQLSMFFSLVGLKQWTTHCRSQLTNLGFGLLIIQNQQFQDIFCGPGVFSVFFDMKVLVLDNSWCYRANNWPNDAKIICKWIKLLVLVGIIFFVSEPKLNVQYALCHLDFNLSLPVEARSL